LWQPLAATRLIDFLSGHAWTVVMPNGSIATTFLARPEEILALLHRWGGM